MSSTLNKVTLIGNIGRVPELRYTPGAKAVVTLSLATSTRRKNKVSNQWEDEVQWHRVIGMGDQAEWAHRELGKGRTVLVEGSIRYGSFEREGQRIPTVDIVATLITPFGAKRPDAAQAGDGAGDESANDSL